MNEELKELIEQTKKWERELKGNDSEKLKVIGETNIYISLSLYNIGGNIKLIRDLIAHPHR